MSDTMTVEERIAALEKQVGSLAARLGKQNGDGGWRSTFGLSKDDEGFEEMNRLGSEYRKSQQPEDADS